MPFPRRKKKEEKMGIFDSSCRKDHPASIAGGSLHRRIHLQGVAVWPCSHAQEKELVVYSLQPLQSFATAETLERGQAYPVAPFVKQWGKSAHHAFCPLLFRDGDAAYSFPAQNDV